MVTLDRDNSHSKRIGVFVDPRWMWRWQGWLIEALRASGHRVELFATGRARGIPGGLRLLLHLETILYGHRGGTTASDLIDLRDFEAGPAYTRTPEDSYDIVLDLAGELPSGLNGHRRLRVLYDGVAGDAALIAGLLERTAPHLWLEDSLQSEKCYLGLCAVEQPELLGCGLDNVFSRVAAALLSAVNERSEMASRRPSEADPREVAPRPSEIGVGRFFLGTLSGKIANRLRKLTQQPPTWGIGWRFVAGNYSVQQTDNLAVPNYKRLSGGAESFYADPFIIWHDGLYHLFFEEFPYASGTGVIAHLTIDEKGTVGPKEVVLSRPYHLSYPFVFRHDDQFYMIPETSGARAIELYRAEIFPNKWVFERTLVADVKADDATLLRTGDGRLWLFAAISQWQSSQWDALGLYSATDLFGDWQAHPANPVLLDARAARPAGAMYEKDGVLYRPAQDCSALYGGGLAVCRVDRLDEEAYAQTVITTLQPRPGDQLLGVHTLNEDRGLEVIDFFGHL